MWSRRKHGEKVLVDTSRLKTAKLSESLMKDFVVPKLKYAVEQRLRFIDFLLHQYGEVNRSALTNYYGISIPQATKDFKAYIKIAPNNTRYSNKFKVYVKNPEFERVWL